MTDRPPASAASGPPWEDPRALLARHGLRAKRAYSQNFLVSQSAVDAIARAAVSAHGATVVELGPGLGTLTAALLRAGARVVGIERDRDMLRVLQEEFANYALEVRREDAAQVDYAAIAREVGAKVAVAGNLPYAVTGAILRNLIGQRAAIERAVLMVQREVRNRLVAEPASADYGALTVFTRAAFEIETIVRLGPAAFHPRPKVESAVVRFTPRAVPLAEETEPFRSVVRAAFQSRRKTLRNALGAAVGAERAAQALAATAIDPDRRGETLAIAEFAALARALEPRPDG